LLSAPALGDFPSSRDDPSIDLLSASSSSSLSRPRKSSWRSFSPAFPLAFLSHRFRSAQFGTSLSSPGSFFLTGFSYLIFPLSFSRLIVPLLWKGGVFFFFESLAFASPARHHRLREQVLFGSPCLRCLLSSLPLKMKVGFARFFLEVQEAALQRSSPPPILFIFCPCRGAPNYRFADRVPPRFFRLTPSPFPPPPFP